MKFFEKITRSDKLFKNRIVKDKIKTGKNILKNYKIELPLKTEIEYFYFEMFLTALQSKEKIECAFIAAYDDMRDYWNTLTFQQKQHLMRIELQPVMKQLPYIPLNNKKIYLPFFDERLNIVYTDEIVLLELKQYNALRFTFDKYLVKQSLTSEMAESGFTSLNLVKRNEKDYYAYADFNTTLYHFDDKHLIHSYQFDKNVDRHLLQQLCEYIDTQDEKSALVIMMEHELVNQHKRTKIKKYLE